jgi:hypothetical protein
MSVIVKASINNLPLIGNVLPIYMTVILNDNSLNQITITSLKTLYGNVTLHQPNVLIINDVNPIAVLVIGTYSGTEYINIIYLNGIRQPQTPNNFAKLVQKIPKGIFNDITTETVVGQDFNARALMINDYYDQYFNVAKQVYSFNYSPQLEFEYNGTVGLLSNNYDSTNLFLWFSSLNIVALNSYDLELAISQYIWFRLGISSPVYINDHVFSVEGYWNLGIPTLTELDSTTILAPESVAPAIYNLVWTIYNSNSFSNEFKQEITNLILRISRADIGNIVTFSNIVDPLDDKFTLVGYTYPNDPRTLYNKCTQFLGTADYPLNIVAYIKT